TLVYATDIHAGGLRQGRAGVYPLARARQFTLNHRAAGARSSLSDYCHVSGEQLVMSRSLREHITFADHSLATDSVFSEVQLVSCRNVLIYFDTALQECALGLFTQALCPRGFLCLGN